MSTKKTLYIIRHGQTDYNKNGIIQGSGIDSDLNATGRQQANQFFNAYRHTRFDNIYTSSLKRTHQTVRPFIDAGHSTEILTALDEINWGYFEGLKTNTRTKQVYQQIVSQWKNGMLDTSVDGGETPNQMYERQQRGLQTLLERSHEEQVLICMHGRAMRSFLCLLTDTPLHRMDEFEHTNLSLYKLRMNGKNFELLERNNVAHLNGAD